MAWFLALIGTYVLWKLSAFFAEHPPKAPRLPRVRWLKWKKQEWEETPHERYKRLLDRIGSLPLTEEETAILKEEARQRYIAESVR